MVFGSGVFGRWSGHENRTLIQGVSALIGEALERSLAFVSGKLSSSRSLKFSFYYLCLCLWNPNKRNGRHPHCFLLFSYIPLFCLWLRSARYHWLYHQTKTGLLTITVLLFSLSTELFLVPNIFLIARYSFLFPDCIFFCSSGLFLFMYAPSFQSHWSHSLIFFDCFVPEWSLLPKSTIILLVYLIISHVCNFLLILGF